MASASASASNLGPGIELPAARVAAPGERKQQTANPPLAGQASNRPDRTGHRASNGNGHDVVGGSAGYSQPGRAGECAGQRGGTGDAGGSAGCGQPGRAGECAGQRDGTGNDVAGSSAECGQPGRARQRAGNKVNGNNNAGSSCLNVHRDCGPRGGRFSRTDRRSGVVRFGCRRSARHGPGDRRRCRRFSADKERHTGRRSRAGKRSSRASPRGSWCTGSGPDGSRSPRRARGSAGCQPIDDRRNRSFGDHFDGCCGARRFRHRDRRPRRTDDAGCDSARRDHDGFRAPGSLPSPVPRTRVGRAAGIGRAGTGAGRSLRRYHRRRTYPLAQRRPQSRRSARPRPPRGPQPFRSRRRRPAPGHRRRCGRSSPRRSSPWSMHPTANM